MRPYPGTVRAPAILDGLDWFNGPPRRLSDPGGRLTLLDFQTYG